MFAEPEAASVAEGLQAEGKRSVPCQVQIDVNESAAKLKIKCSRKDRYLAAERSLS